MGIFSHIKFRKLKGIIPLKYYVFYHFYSTMIIKCIVLTFGFSFLSLFIFVTKNNIMRTIGLYKNHDVNTK